MIVLVYSVLLYQFADSNKTIADVLEEFEDGGCLSEYDRNEVRPLKNT